MLSSFQKKGKYCQLRVTGIEAPEDSLRRARSAIQQELCGR